MEADKSKPPKSLVPRWLGWIGGLTTALGVFLLVRPIDNCGSVLSPDLSASQLGDTLSGVYGREAACIESLKTATVPAWVITCIGIVLILAAVISFLVARQQLLPSAVPQQRLSLAEELEKLDSLRTREVITHNEFEQQKARLLSRETPEEDVGNV